MDVLLILIICMNLEENYVKWNMLISNSYILANFTSITTIIISAEQYYREQTASC